MIDIFFFLLLAKRVCLSYGSGSMLSAYVAFPGVRVQLRSSMCLGSRENYSKYSCATHGRLSRLRKLRACDVGEAKEGLENEL